MNEEMTNEKSMKQGLLSLAKITIYEVPMKTQDTNSKYRINK